MCVGTSCLLKWGTCWKGIRIVCLDMTGLKLWDLTPPLTLTPTRILTVRTQEARDRRKENVCETEVWSKWGMGRWGVGTAKRKTAVCCRSQAVAMVTGIEGAASYAGTHTLTPARTHTHTRHNIYTLSCPWTLITSAFITHCRLKPALFSDFFVYQLIKSSFLFHVSISDKTFDTHPHSHSHIFSNLCEWDLMHNSPSLFYAFRPFFQ